MGISWLKVTNIVDENDEIKTFYFECPSDFTWDLGAHTHFALKGFNAGEKPNRSLVRHMSICTIPSENIIGITTRIKEQCSEFKSILKSLKVGDEVAFFKTYTDLPLKREGKRVYLLSSGVGLATLRGFAVDYLANQQDITAMYSLNIEKTKAYLYPNIFVSDNDKNFTASFVDNRDAYYSELKKICEDNDGIYYIVGSDEFLAQNIALLFEHGIQPEQIMLDKHEEGRKKLLGIHNVEA